MKWTASQSVLGLALLVTLIAAWFAPPAETEVVDVSPRTASVGVSPSSRVGMKVAPPQSQRATPLAVLRIRPRDGAAFDTELLFASTEWEPAPYKDTPVARAAIREQPQTPQAPPPPFRVLGRYEEAGQPAVFLEHQNQNLVVRVGDTIGGLYRVESLDQATLTMRYLPLDVSQILELGGAP